MKWALIALLTGALAGAAIRQHQILLQSFELTDQAIAQTERAIAAGEKWHRAALQCGEAAKEDK